MARSRETVQTPRGIESSGIDVLDRAMAILFAFQRHDPPLTLTEIANRTGLYKSTALRLATALCHHRFLMRNEDGRFQLGSAPLTLAASYQASFNLSDVLLPLMQRLNREFGEAVSFHVRQGQQRVCLYRISARHTVRAEVQQGDIQPLDRGAGGRILLAFGGEEGALYDEVRQRYCYLSLGERDPETSGISVPVFGAQQQLVGALGLVGPVSRMGRAEMQHYQPHLLRAAAQATELLGGDASGLLTAASQIAAQIAIAAAATTLAKE